MNKLMLNLYSTYLQISTARITATNFSSLLDSTLSHDRLTCFLSEKDLKSSDLWGLVRLEVRKLEATVSEEECGVLIIDDFIAEKRISMPIL